MTPNIFFTSDLHHAHNNIIKFTNRATETTIEDHTQWLIDKWNSVVKPGDIVYHLGDLSFAKSYEDLASFVGQLNGSIFCIHGNHDNIDFLNRLLKNRLITWHGPYKKLTIDKQKLILFHYPIAAWDQQRYGSWHIHGHCHSRYQGPGKSLDVGIDNSFYIFGLEHRLFTFEDIATFMSNQPLYVADDRDR